MKPCCELAKKDLDRAAAINNDGQRPHWDREAAYLDWVIAQAHLRYCAALDVEDKA